MRDADVRTVLDKISNGTGSKIKTKTYVYTNYRHQPSGFERAYSLDRLRVFVSLEIGANQATRSIRGIMSNYPKRIPRL